MERGKNVHTSLIVVQRLIIASVMLVSAIAQSQDARAHAGHDHRPAVAVSTSVAPRFEAASDDLEALGVLRGPDLTLTLDRFRTNEPVATAKIDTRIALAEAKPARLTRIAGTVAQKDCDDTRTELQILNTHRTDVRATVRETVVLTAPISGIISVSTAVPGQLATAREALLRLSIRHACGSKPPPLMPTLQLKSWQPAPQLWA